MRLYYVLIAGTMFGATLVVQERAAPVAGREVVAFLAPTSRGARDIAGRLSLDGVRVRIVLLIPEFKQVAAWVNDDDARDAVKDLQAAGLLSNGLSLFDEDGLDLARRLGIARVPAIAVLDAGAARVAYGTGVDLAELLK